MAVCYPCPPVSTKREKLFTMSSFPAEARAASQFTFDTLVDFQIPSDPQLSPDGTRIAFARGTTHKADQNASLISAIYLADVATGIVRRFAGDERADTRTPRWSP